VSIGAYRSVGLATLPRELWPSTAYAGLLTLIGRAERAIVRGDVQDAHNALIRAQQIVHMLRSSLRPDPSGLSQRLEALYQFVSDQLAQANLTKDAAQLQPLVAILTPLRTAWEQAGRAALQGTSPSAGPGGTGA
jgi:flagellar protein FliS